MQKPNAVFLCSPVGFLESIFHVYDEETLAKLEEKVNLPRIQISRDNMDEHKELLAKADYVFSTWGMPDLTEEEIKTYLPNVKAVVYGAGAGQGCARPFLNLGSKGFSAWAANAVPVAEYTVAQIILAGKGFYQGIRMQDRLGKMDGREAFNHYSHTFPCNYNCKIGILGAGMIGKLVIKMLQAYDMEVLVYDPYVPDAVIEGLGAKKASLETIIEECQTVYCPKAKLPATVGILKYEHFSRMKPNATFINTGRGAQVVEADLIRALQEEPNRTAVLDVTWPEPPVEDSPFWTLPNVFLTPHIAGSMENERARMGAFMEQEFSHLIAGEPCNYEVSLKMLETMA